MSSASDKIDSIAKKIQAKNRAKTHESFDAAETSTVTKVSYGEIDDRPLQQNEIITTVPQQGKLVEVYYCPSTRITRPIVKPV